MNLNPGFVEDIRILKFLIKRISSLLIDKNYNKVLHPNFVDFLKKKNLRMNLIRSNGDSGFPVRFCTLNPLFEHSILQKTSRVPN